MIDSTLKNANILILDDQQSNIDILTELLDIKGFINYRATTDSRIVFDLFEELKPDLLLLDLNMPYLNGFQVMMHLKSMIPVNTYLPILVLTADITIESKQKALAGGASDFLTKPFDLIEVDLRINNLLKARYLHQQLENQNLILEEKVRLRTAELEKINMELIASKDRAEEMNRVKSYFLSNMSHELRTPLISILGFAELLRQELENNEQLEFVNYILEGGQRLNNTLTSILELTKLETSESFLALKPCNLSDEIEKRVKSFLPMAQSKKLFIKTELGDSNIIANIDDELFGKALYHLVNNAIKFTKQGGVYVIVKRERKHDIYWAVIKIIDTGSGIPKDNIEKIFGAFRQASEGNSRSHEGAGLGLTITKKIIKLMKGKIEVESNVDKGSIFSIWLPAVLDNSQINKKVEELSRVSFNQPPTKEEKGLQKVLLVEDNKANRLFIKLCLSSKVRIIEAEDGIYGITLALKEKFDLILMDINLGAGIDGIEAMHQIRKSPEYMGVPIIAVTALVMPGDKERFINEGFDDYLAKPFSKNDLVSLVQKYVRKVISIEE